MSAKIKFNIFNTLFRLFSFLADKTNGWGVFVKPKLLFGALIIGVMSVSANSCKKSEPEITCYDQYIEEPLCYDAPPPEEEPFCYLPPPPATE